MKDTNPISTSSLESNGSEDAVASAQQAANSPPLLPKENLAKQSHVHQQDVLPIEGKQTCFQVITQLLKNPLRILVTMEQKEQFFWKYLLSLACVALALFGVLVGSFSGGHQLWIAPVKIVGGVFFSALLCLPSLYIFSYLSGVEAKVQTIMGVLACAVALIALLLLGVAPVVWLFSISSTSLPFFGGLCLVFWLVCLFFGMRFLLKAMSYLGAKNNVFHLRSWVVIFVFVTLQMPVTLRPVIGTSEDFFHFSEKKFFIQYWGEQIQAASQDSQEDRSLSN